MISKEELCRLAKPATKIVPIKELGTDICVRRFSGFERNQYDEWLLQYKDDEGNLRPNTPAMPKLISMGIADDNGQQMFSDDDIPMIDGWDFQVQVEILREIQHFNGLGKEGEEEAGKNSENPES